jgi:hypothetical protein
MLACQPARLDPRNYVCSAQAVAMKAPPVRQPVFGFFQGHETAM